MTVNLILAAALASLTPASSPRSCQTDTLSRVIKDKDDAAPYVIHLKSGRRLRIEGQDFIDPRKWRRGELVTICPTEDDGYVEVTDKKRDERLLTWTDARPR